MKMKFIVHHQGYVPYETEDYQDALKMKRFCQGDWIEVVFV